jgi:glycosyltransferase involved in cell wall biosynthesis
MATGETRSDPIAFRRDDVVLVLGAAWEWPRMLERLVEEQNHVGFAAATMIHDLIPVECPHFVSPRAVTVFTSYLHRVLRLSSVLVVVSDATKRSLEKWCAEQGITPPPLQIAYHGDGFHRPEVSSRPSSLPDGEFVLSVSTVEPRKNYYLLYQVVKQAKLEKTPIPRIVIVGRAGWKTGDLQDLLRNDATLRDSLTWLEDVSDSELTWLYEKALFTLFPSLIEGWGLPVSESISFGKFCISSNLSSMPEIAGDLIDYASPYDPAEWVRAIHRYSADPGLLAQRVDRIRREYQGRTWDDTARAIEAVLPIDRGRATIAEG